MGTWTAAEHTSSSFQVICAHSLKAGAQGPPGAGFRPANRDGKADATGAPDRASVVPGRKRANKINEQAVFHFRVSNPRRRTDANGQVQITIATDIVGQAEFIDGTCTDAYGNHVGSEYDFAVGYGDLYYNDHPSIWVKIGGDDTNGGSGQAPPPTIAT